MRLIDEIKTALANASEVLTPKARRTFYGQFGEDAVLQSFFHERIRDNKPGFYVDIGAFAPVIFSNTHWFYRHGWRGINVDATPGSMRAFALVRPRDINLEHAVSSGEGQVVFYQLGIRSVMNTVDRETALALSKREGIPIRERSIRARSLRAILDEHLPRGQQIDFMSIDVEGHDAEVLRSNDWTRYAPTMLMVEVHANGVDQVLGSDTFSLVREHGYVMCAWVPPTVFFRRADRD